MAHDTDAETPTFVALDGFRKKLAAVDRRKPGAFQFELTGEESGDFAVEVDEDREVKLRTGRSDRTPRNLVRGDGRTIRRILDGELDAGTAFLRGGIQFRGDVRYLEHLLRELKLQKPRGGA